MLNGKNSYLSGEGSGMSFENEIDGLKGFYPISALATVKKFASKLEGVRSGWSSALAEMKVDSPRSLEENSFLRLGDFKSGDKVVVGLAGPGAVGKNALASLLGYPRIINTTTRVKRANEIEGVHYYFCSEQEFEKMKSGGVFLTTTHRPGRGNYGISKLAVSAAFQKSRVLIAEENPATLAEISRRVSELGAKSILVYVLPPAPVAAHLAARLAVRVAETGEDFELTIESTLGERQIKEFLSTAELAKNGIRILYVVNDDLERIASKIRKFIQG